MNAVKADLPTVYHGMCCQHIAENVQKRFGREYKASFWQIARARSSDIFENSIRALRQASPQVEEYLSSIGYENFAFLHFPLPRFGHDTSNIVESTNSVWRDIRELPPLQLLNGIYQWTVTTWYDRQRLHLASGNSVLSNMAYSSYKSRETAARGFRVLPSSNTSFLVTTSRGSEFIVKLQDASCSCRKYQDYLSPCSHAIACIQYIGQDTFQYFTRYYNWDVSKRIYETPIPLVTIQGLKVLEDEEGCILNPPVKRAKRGRPKVARIRANYSIY